MKLIGQLWTEQIGSDVPAQPAGWFLYSCITRTITQDFTENEAQRFNYRYASFVFFSFANLIDLTANQYS